MKKQFISFLLCIALLCSFIITVHASIISESSADFAQIFEVGCNLLRDVEHEKELYGMSNVNFDNLYISDYIPTYIYTKTGLEESSIRIYPILENGKWVATLQAYKADGVWTAQLSTKYIANIGSIDEQTNLSMFFDSESGYLRKNDSFVKISEYSPISERLTLDMQTIISSRSALTKSSTIVNKQKMYIDDTSSTSLFSSDLPPGQVTLNVPLISKFEVMPASNRQTDNKACWAAALRAVGKFFNKERTIDYIYEYMGIDKYEAGTTSDASYFLRYSLQKPNTLGGSMSFEALQAKLYDNKPIIGAANFNDYENNPTSHSVVIRGYVRYDNNLNYAGSFSYVENEVWLSDIHSNENAGPATVVAVCLTHSQAYNYHYPFVYDSAVEGYFQQFVIIN